MKKLLVNLLKIGIPFGVGFYLVWFFYNSMDEEQREGMFDAFQQADYSWVLLSILLGWLSHLSRAYRWLYSLEAVAERPKFWNAYHALMIGYIINLTVPRSGELSRAGFLSRYEKVSFEKGVGTIVVERVLDLIMLGIIFLIALSLQYDRIMEMLEVAKSRGGTETGGTNWLIWAVIVIGVIGAALFIIPKTRVKLLAMANGFFQGILSVLKMKKKWQFIGHTIFIWTMYVTMFAICYQCLDATKEIPFGGILTGFIAGTIGVMLMPGGLGAYPGLVALSLASYQIDEGTGSGLGNIIWASQNILIIIAGIASLVLMPLYNKNKKNEQIASENI